LGRTRAREAMADYARQRGVKTVELLPADGATVHHAESLLTGAVGSASARVMIASVVEEEPLNFGEVMHIIDDASQVLAYSRRLEQQSRELEAATTELRDANVRLRELDQMKDDFISTVTHELRTPLTSIRAFSEILRDNPTLAQAQRENFLAIIIRESERLTRLINQVLDLAKLESGNTAWQFNQFDLREAIEESVNAMGQVFRDNRVTVQTHLPANAPDIVADRDRIMQVLFNLLSNAAKFCIEGEGRIRVSLTQGERVLRVDVADNGIGISPEDQAIIFDKFRQAGDTLTQKPKGSGLGLAISRIIVEHFGGRLWVASRLGSGATFSFTLPLMRNAAPRPAPGAAA
ncbi:MAG: HAMP domain-containing histidine kinase, partial [Betaproteobacteria bacterium]|nr:HAMP domain-containing histidine kinase [Betaproteobacteria bacterium]